MKKEIKISDLKDSPIAFAGVIGLFIVVILGFSVYLIMDIFTVKGQIVEAREEYRKNCEQIVYLQHVRSEYNTLSAQKEMMDRMLPTHKDVYDIMADFYDKCDKYNLDVSEFATPTEATTYTFETTVILTVTGTYENIISFVGYYANLEQIHRIEQITLTDAETTGLKTAQIKIVVLAKD